MVSHGARLDDDDEDEEERRTVVLGPATPSPSSLEERSKVDISIEIG